MSAGDRITGGMILILHGKPIAKRVSTHNFAFEGSDHPKDTPRQSRRGTTAHRRSKDLMVTPGQVGTVRHGLFTTTQWSVVVDSPRHLYPLRYYRVAVHRP